MKLDFFPFVLVILICAGTNHAMNLICYFDSFSSTSYATVKYTVRDINSSLCTHLVYNYVQLDPRTFDIDNPYSDMPSETPINTFGDLVGIKKRNSNLKVMAFLQINTRNLPLVIDVLTTRSMVANVIKFLRFFRFDGVELDIRSSWIGNTSIMDLVEPLGHKLKEYEFLFGAMASKDVAGNNTIDCTKYNTFIEFLAFTEYDIGRLKNILDFLDLPTFDYHNPRRQPGLADHHAPLFSRSWDTENNVDFSVNQWINKGFPAEKIVLTVPLFGRSWTLLSNVSNPPAPAQGEGLIGKLTKREGFIMYYDICKVVQNDSWQVFQDPDQLMGPYAISPPNSDNKTTWIGYDDPDMAVVKSKYVLSKGLGGISLPEMNNDDFRNRCGRGHSPILTAISTTLKIWPPRNSSILTTTQITTNNSESSTSAFKSVTPSVPFKRTSTTNKTREPMKSTSFAIQFNRCEIAFRLGLAVSICYLIAIFYVFILWFQLAQLSRVNQQMENQEITVISYRVKEESLY